MPRLDRGRARRAVGSPSLWLVAGAIVVFVLVTLDVLHDGLGVRLDHDVSRQMQHLHLNHHLWRRRAVYVLTLFGQRGTVLVLTIPTIGAIAWLRRSLDPVLRYALALALVTVVVYAIKSGVGRTAPPLDSLHAGGASYPSGHVANAVLIWGLLWFAAQDDRLPAQLRRVLGVFRWLGPICIVIGMGMLDYHWMTDFIAGACVGIVLLAVVTAPVWTIPSTWLDAQVARSRPKVTT